LFLGVRSEAVEQSQSGEDIIIIGRVRVARRPISAGTCILAVLACLAAALATSATRALAAEPPKCPVNEQRRSESDINSATEEPYSAGLLDCRAYEMVSPLYKQGHDALPEFSVGGLPVAPDGNTAGFWSEGTFAAENFLSPYFSQYLSRRGAQGWITSSTFAPRELVDLPYPMGINGDSTLDLRSLRLSCGQNPAGQEPAILGKSLGLACVRRELNGSWVSTPTYRPLNGAAEATSHYGGASSDLSRVFITTEQASAFVPSATLTYAIYEIAGVGSASPILRLVDVNEGAELRSPLRESFAYLGANHSASPTTFGSRYQAISSSGESVFFTSVPKEGGEEPTLYGRVPCRSGSNHCEYVEKAEDVEEVKEGMVVKGRRVMSEGPNRTEANASTGRETVAVSDPSNTECKGCLAIAERKPEAALFQGASADGTKVFFTTTEKLFKEDEDPTPNPNLYEYDFTKPEGEKLVWLSRGSEGPAEVSGVIRSSADGSHVYFVAEGALKSAPNTTVNEGGHKEHQEAKKNQSNLYAYGCEKIAAETKCETKFVAPAKVEGIFSEFGEGAGGSQDISRPAQVTPDGRYLAFSSGKRLAGALNKKPEGKEFTGEAVYRYDFQTGQLTWISHGAPGFKNEKEGQKGYQSEGEPSKGTEGESSLVPPLPGGRTGSAANANDWNRAISGCPVKGERSKTEELEFSCPEGEYDGEYIIFVTAEKLQANDENRAPDVYEWHCASHECPHPSAEGEVHMISDGRDPVGVVSARERGGLGGGGGEGSETADTVGMSASGADVFFSTHTQLVQQDTDSLRDVYDARVDGGFPAPPAKPSCSGEGCQGPQTTAPTFPDPLSSLAPAGGNGLTGNSGQRSSLSLRLAKAKLSGNALLVTVNLSAGGTVRISGRGLKTTTKILSAGAHQVRVALTKAGASPRGRHKRTSVRISLTVGRQTVAKTMTVRL
jgi:hypothetical protein